jgi:hypothetical protein
MATNKMLTRDNLAKRKSPISILIVLLLKLYGYIVLRLLVTRLFLTLSH